MGQVAILLCQCMKEIFRSTAPTACSTACPIQDHAGCTPQSPSARRSSPNSTPRTPTPKCTSAASDSGPYTPACGFEKPIVATDLAVPHVHYCLQTYVRSDPYDYPSTTAASIGYASVMPCCRRLRVRPPKPLPLPLGSSPLPAPLIFSTRHC